MNSTPNKINLNYILSHSDQTKYKIPHCYDRQQWKIGETYRIRVGHIYDPSKFWIVFKERELDIFQKFVNDFYKKHGGKYKMDLNNMAKNMYCVVYVDKAFYRGLIANIPDNFTEEKKAYIFLFDYGCVTVTSLDHLYYLYEKLFHIPQFAVRASLSHVQPYDKTMWKYSVVKRFSELVSAKVLLCVLECTNPNRKIVEISIGDVREFSSVIDVGDILISEKLAKSVISRANHEIKEKIKTRYVPKTKYPHLFPSFEAIESGMVPPCVHTTELLWQCIARDVLFRPYFAYNGVEN
ncbi:hypothetical protein NQ318_006561 [Aromia moschata]|uniref:Tudor domain-containing protein n=1 Tax=Aromia moschata TaxID=1265417 RepID=A0AAV8YQR1_9CUCU|nr:hypothetical protein NQ318_006561 [Aromia moschata]